MGLAGSLPDSSRLPLQVLDRSYPDPIVYGQRTMGVHPNILPYCVIQIRPMRHCSTKWYIKWIPNEHL